MRRAGSRWCGRSSRPPFAASPCRAAALAARIDPELIRTRAQRLESGPAAPPADLASVMALMHRTIAYVAAAP